MCGDDVVVVVFTNRYDKLGPLLYFYDPLNDYKVFIHFLTAIITVSKFYSSSFLVTLYTL